MSSLSKQMFNRGYTGGYCDDNGMRWIYKGFLGIGARVSGTGTTAGPETVTKTKKSSQKVLDISN